MILELLRVILAAYRYISEEIDERQFESSVRKRKENYKKFMSSDRNGRLNVLRDENES